MRWHFLSICLLGVLLTGCPRTSGKPSFIIGTTTSVDNSGLLTYLVSRFESESGVEVHWLAVGSGKALRLAAEGKVDLVISHDPVAERRFVASGKSLLQEPFARNDFVLVGPPSNPAGVAAEDTAVAAFRKIVISKSPFVSRNDESGTHSRELDLWRRAGIQPDANPRYEKLGQSMSALLRSASELSAYTLTDLATYRQLEPALHLRIVNGGDALYRNIYSITLVKDPGSPEEIHAGRFAEWILHGTGRELVYAYRVRGRPVFFPVGTEELERQEKAGR